jgi:uncharacterized protein DUF2652
VALARDGDVLVLADISGYTYFVGGTVLEHGKLWTARLLDLIAERITPKLRLSAIEGDALLFYGTIPRPDTSLVPLLVDTYQEFRRVAQTIDPCTGCVCDACDSGRDLQLKYIVHAGTFVQQSVAGLVQLFGHDVNVACRLLKNQIPAKQYVFVTDAAASLVPLDDGVPHVETADIGEVRGRYRLLA